MPIEKLKIATVSFGKLQSKQRASAAACGHLHNLRVHNTPAIQKHAVHLRFVRTTETEDADVTSIKLTPADLQQQADAQQLQRPGNLHTKKVV